MIVYEDAKRKLAESALRGELAIGQDFRRIHPNGSRTDAIRWVRGLKWKLMKHDGRWMFFYLVAAVGPGPERTIDDKVVNCDRAYGMWSGCRLLPSFDSCADAVEWAQNCGIEVAVPA